MGFTYFNPSNLNQKHKDKQDIFIIAKNAMDEVVGVLNIGEYQIFPGKTYKGINYIDVHWAYRQLGIARKLFRKLNEIVKPDDIIIGGEPSEQGKKANILNVLAESINKCPCFGTMQDFYNSQLYCSLLSKNKKAI